MNERGAKSKLERAEITDILKLLPHRYPFLLVDRVVSMVPRTSIHAIKAVSMSIVPR